MHRVVAFAYTKPPAYPPLTEIRSRKKKINVRSLVPVVERFSDKCVCCAVLYCGVIITERIYRNPLRHGRHFFLSE